MADEFSIDISGIEETIEMLNNAPELIAKNAFARALAAGAVPIVEALEARTPEHTGLMKGSIVTDVAIDANGRGGIAQVGYGRQGWKARLVEYGHRMIGHKPAKKDEGTVRAHPFMRPAAAASGEAAVEAVAESLNETFASKAIPGLTTEGSN